LVLSFVFGAAVMFFRLPTSEFLTKAFVGAQAWGERRAADGQPRAGDPVPAAGAVDRRDKTFDGFTLCTFASLNGNNTQAVLFNMERRAVHRWEIPFGAIWHDPPHVRVRGSVRDDMVCFFACHLYPNGELLVVLHGVQQDAVGYGLVKLDRNSNVVWKYAANTHHDVDVGPDGTIYAIEHTVLDRLPERLEFIPAPCLTDSLVTLTPDGRVKGKPLPLLEAFRDSPYATLLRALEPDDGARRPDTRFGDRTVRTDALHTNTVRVLTPELAPKFPMFKAGQVLISLRELDTIAVVDLERRGVVWAATGPWDAQHDPQFLDGGNILVFDNLGLPSPRSRVLEYDPRTQAFPWSYSGENGGGFFTRERGMSQRRPNGNTLIVDSEGGKLLEVTRAKEVAWTCAFPSRFVCSGRRYAPEQVPFLEGDRRRPRSSPPP
jgi:hypothetical protein